MDLHALRVALANQISAVIPAPLTATWYVPAAATEPQIWIRPDSIDFDKTMRRGLDEVTLKATLAVSKADDQAAQINLDAYLAGSGPLSIKAAIEAGRGAPGKAALGGACDDLHVTQIAAYRYYVLGNETYLGAEFSIRCIGSGG